MKLRLGIEGPGGCGKTRAALTIAKTLIGEPLIEDLEGPSDIVLIDTERKTSELLAKMFAFNVITLPQHHHAPAHYIAALRAAERVGARVIIVDSATPEWAHILQEVDSIALKARGVDAAKTAWGKVRPMHDEFVDALCNVRAHLIVTFRSKPVTVIRSVDGRSVVEKLGLDPQQDAWIENAFSVMLRLDMDHRATVTKSHVPELDRREFAMIDEGFVTVLDPWLEDGAHPLPLAETIEGAVQLTVEAAIEAGTRRDTALYQEVLATFGTWCQAHGIPKEVYQRAATDVRAQVASHFAAAAGTAGAAPIAAGETS